MTDTTPWDIVNTMFRSDKSVLVQHQINSYNKFILSQLPQIVEQYNPITVMHSYNEKQGKYETEVKIFFSNLTYNKPIIHENNGSTKPMTPAIARLRNLTYSSNIYVDIKLEVTVHSGEDLSVSNTHERKVCNVNIGKMPVMLMSELCVLPWSWECHVLVHAPPTLVDLQRVGQHALDLELLSLDLKRKSLDLEHATM